MPPKSDCVPSEVSLKVMGIKSGHQYQAIQFCRLNMTTFYCLNYIVKNNTKGKNKTKKLYFIHVNLLIQINTQNPYMIRDKCFGKKQFLLQN